MPIAGIFLNLSAENLCPWRWPAWQGLVGVALPPWAPKEEVDAAGGKVKYFDTMHLEAARTFAKTFYSKVGNDRQKFMVKRSDNDSMGRNAIINWVNQLVREAKIGDKISQILRDKRAHPYDFMHQLYSGPGQVCHKFYLLGFLLMISMLVCSSRKWEMCKYIGTTLPLPRSCSESTRMLIRGPKTLSFCWMSTGSWTRTWRSTGIRSAPCSFESSGG